jgi:hypothetical protein
VEELLVGPCPAVEQSAQVLLNRDRSDLVLLAELDNPALGLLDPRSARSGSDESTSALKHGSLPMT